MCHRTYSSETVILLIQSSEIQSTRKMNDYPNKAKHFKGKKDKGDKEDENLLDLELILGNFQIYKFFLNLKE